MPQEPPRLGPAPSSTARLPGSGCCWKAVAAGDQPSGGAGRPPWSTLSCRRHVAASCSFFG